MQLLNPATWVIVLAFVVVLLETLSFFVEKRKSLWRVLILISAALILGLGVTAQTQQEAFNRELANKSDEIAKKSDKIAELTSEIAFMSSGGDSFCYLAFIFNVDAPNTPLLVVVHEGKYPLQNVHMVMTDVELLNTIVPGIPKGRSNARPATAEELDKADKLNVLLDVPFLGPPGTTFRLRPRWNLPKRDQVTYSIQIYTQFQTFHQHLKLRKVDGRWTIAFRVIKPVSDKEPLVLREEVPKNFPRDQSGKVNWSYF